MAMAAGSRRPVMYAIYAALSLLLLTAIFHSSGGASTTIKKHAPWAYRPKSSFEEHTAQKHSPNGNDAYADEISDSANSKSPGPSSALADEEDVHGVKAISTDSPSEGNGHGKWAYATFLETKEEDEPDDAYFTACRTLVYQLLHHPKTKTNNGIPLLVLTPPHVHTRKLDMLEDEGAKVIKVERMDMGGEERDFMDPSGSGPRASVQFARLRMWEMAQYTRILYVDSATLLMKPIDDIFKETLVGGDMRALGKIEAHQKFDDIDGGGSPPESYFMAGVPDAKSWKHEFPPKDDEWFMQGFYMLKPDASVFKYYESILKHPERFDVGRLMTGLLNHAHKKDGPMPWSPFPAGKWSVNYPGPQDLKGGAATLHAKFWDSKTRKNLDRLLVEMWWRIQGQMEGFWFRRGADDEPKSFG